MVKQAMFIVAIIGLCVLSVSHELGAEPRKLRTDLTGRTNITPEEVITGLTPRKSDVRTRGLKSSVREMEPVLSAIAVTIHFAFDSSEILPQAVPNLQSLGRALASPQLEAYQIRIEGHTDSTGPSAYNLGLSRRRANSVKQYLVQHFDVSPDRLLTEGYGEDEPITTNATPVGRGKNRRAEFVNLNTAASNQ